MDMNDAIAQIDHEKIQRSISPLRMSNFHFSKIEASFLGEKFKHTKMKLDVSREFFEKNSAKVSITTEIKSEPESLHLIVSAEALFSIDGDVDIHGNPLIQHNAVAIMFPFIRSEITLLTSQPGMSPIVIPALNINKLLDDAKLD